MSLLDLAWRLMQLRIDWTSQASKTTKIKEDGRHSQFSSVLYLTISLSPSVHGRAASRGRVAPMMLESRDTDVMPVKVPQDDYKMAGHPLVLITKKTCRNKTIREGRMYVRTLFFTDCA